MTLPAIPLRLKLLLGLLVLVSVSVGVITFTMARLFHADKVTYMSDLAAAVAMEAARESDVTLAGYKDRFEDCAALVAEPGLPRGAKQAVLQKMLAGVPGVLAVRVAEGGRTLLEMRDGPALAREGVGAGAVARALALTATPGALRGGKPFEVANAVLAPGLPAIRLSLRHPRAAGGAPLQFTALVRAEHLMAIAHRSKAFRVSIVGADGVLLAGRDAPAVARGQRADWVPTADRTSAAVVREMERQGEARIVGLASTERGGLRIAAEIPRSAAFFASRLLLRRLFLVAFALLVMTAVVATLWSRRMTRSLASLAEASRAIGSGRFDVTVAVKGRDELGNLATSFNQMAAELESRDQALKDAQSALIQSEKMAAFGQLGAGIAHEVKNPLAGIQGVCQMTQRQLDPENPLQAPLKLIENEAKRCRTIVENLLRFARQEKVEHGPVDIGAVVGDMVGIMEHQLSLHQVRIVRTIDATLPRITGNGNQIQQVLMNLALNAQQAMGGKPGEVCVEAHAGSAGGVVIRVRDNGPGIPKEIQKRIFEPFFTTKPTGQGTGLGLSVSYGIIQEHQGTIRVESEPGQGTTFVIELPARRTEGPAAPAPGDAGPEAKAA